MVRVLLSFALSAACALAQSAAAQLQQVEQAIRSGDAAKARQMLQAVQCQPHDGPSCAASRSAMEGNLHLFSGQYDGAAGAYRAALAAYESLGDTRRALNLRNNLGTVHFYRGEYGEAYAQYRAARETLARFPREPWFTSMSQMTEVNLATLWQRLGRYGEALKIYQVLGRAPEGLSAPERAQMLSNLAALNRRLGDPWKARKLLEEALALLSPEKDRDVWLGIVKNLGIVLALDFDDLGAAEKQFDNVLAVALRANNAREAMQARLYLADTYYRRKEWDRALSLWRTTLDESRALKTGEDEWRSLYGIARACRQLQRRTEAEVTLSRAMSKIESLNAAMGTATLRTEFLSDKTDAYDEALDMAASRGDVVESFRAMDRARSLLLREARGVPEVTLDKARARLAPGEALLLYRTGRARTVLLWATRESAGVQRIDLPEQTASRLVDEIRAFRTGWQDASARLSTQLLARIPRAERLWIVADGVLALLPFELLPSSGRPLIAHTEVAYLPAAGFLRWPDRPAPARSFPWQVQLTAYANPDVKAAPLLPGDERWTPLAASHAEVQAISRNIPGRLRFFEAAAITPQELLREAAMTPLLHLATHGAGDSEDPQRNRLLIGASYLYGGQLKANQFPSLDLVVLSACETDYGVVSRGEGVQSLARSFLLAGARTTVASMWKVDDSATRLFMEEFYRRTARGEPIASALRGVKLHFLDSGTALAEPRFWAAFVAQGNASDPLRQSYTWTHVLVAAATLALASATALRIRKRRRAQSK